MNLGVETVEAVTDPVYVAMFQHSLMNLGVETDEMHDSKPIPRCFSIL